jgi:CheY-like chemotaxis protein
MHHAESQSGGVGAAYHRRKGKPLVLLVEDYRETREMYAHFLRLSGFQVAEASNGYEAVNKAADLTPDIILMDLALPGMDGWEATRQLKQQKQTSDIPVVALSGHSLPQHKESARTAGCVSFMSKPADPESVVDEVRATLEKCGHSTEPGDPAG